MYNTIKVGTTFSGIGAPEQALIKLNIDHKVMWACDIDKNAKKTYLDNYECEVFYDDITKINLDELEYVDLYVYGFPCQNFSSCGKKLGMEEERGQLIYYSCDILNKIRPKYFIAENVKGLIGHDNGNTFRIIKKLLVDCGYKIYYQVLNSRNFDVPQSRERIFIVGIRNDIDEDFIFPIGNNHTPHLTSILESNVDNKYTLSDEKYENLKITKEKKKAKGNGFCYREIDKIAHCLIASGYACGTPQFLKQTGKNPRQLTPRECMRLQGFPDSFKISDSDIIAYRQVGNSITVNVLVEIFRSLLIEKDSGLLGLY